MGSNRVEKVAARRYMELLKGCLTRTVIDEPFLAPVRGAHGLRGIPARFAAAAVSRFGATIAREVPPYAPNMAGEYPKRGETMISRARLDQLDEAIETVVTEDVPGDLIETGVWRGGSVILMRAALDAYGDPERTVWAADSFQGLPKPDPGRYPVDKDNWFWMCDDLAVPLDQVKANIERFGLLDDRVQFLAGWFKDTLPTAPIGRLAVLRLDGDMYESTIQALEALYPKLSSGGYCIVDDYWSVVECQAAVNDYRRDHGVVEPFRRIDEHACYWRRDAAASHR